MTLLGMFGAWQALSLVRPALGHGDCGKIQMCSNAVCRAQYFYNVS